MRDGDPLANAIFDVWLRQWKAEGWRVRIVRGPCKYHGRVDEDSNMVYLYPDQIVKDDTDPAMVQLEEMVHIGTDLDNFPAIEHRMVRRITGYLWAGISDKRKGILAALVTMGE